MCAGAEGRAGVVIGGGVSARLDGEAGSQVSGLGAYEVFTHHYQDVTKYAASRTRVADEVKDVVQEAYLRVFRLTNPERVREPRRFLFRLVRNLILDNVRRRQVRERHAAAGDACVECLPDAAPAPDYAASETERRALLAGAVAMLPERTRAVFILHSRAGMSYAEIADHMALSKTAVAKHLAKAVAVVTEALARP
ncbi:MAG: RNA polymerase sigma factor [Verrucomicrobiota bacterium]